MAKPKAGRRRSGPRRPAASGPGGRGHGGHGLGGHGHGGHGHEGHGQASDGLPPGDLPPAERQRRARFLPRIARIFGLPVDRAEAMLCHPLGQSARINALSPRPAAAIEQDLQALGVDPAPIPWCRGAFELHGDKRLLSESALFRDGDVHIQNAASLVPPLALGARPGDRVLDLCAAPGGKASHIAALVGNDLHLHLNDAMQPRLRKMAEVTDALGVRVAEVTSHPAQYADKFIEGPFDRILLDAQCSGEGMLDLSHPNALRYWAPERIGKMARLQQRMLMAAWKLLRPGGTLVYATCTFAPEENEGPVDHLVRHRADARIVPIDLAIPGRLPGLPSWDGHSFHPSLADALRLTPGSHLEGFFVCRIDKLAEGAA